MAYREILGTVSVLLQFSCLVPYFIGIFRKRIKPHGFTWLLWSLLSGITLFIQIDQQAGAGAWLTAINMLLDGLIALLAFWYGTFTVTRSDRATFLVALLAIPLWLATDTPLWSVLIVCGINVLASWPTFRKSWHKPREEFLWTFLLGGVSAFLSIAALPGLRATVMLYPLVIGVSNLALVGMIIWRRRSVKN